MKFVEVVFNSLPEHPRPAQVLSEFVKSGKDCIELIFDEDAYKNVYSCVNSYNLSIKKLKISDSVAVHRWGDRVYLVKPNVNELSGFRYASDYTHAYHDGAPKCTNWTLIFNEFMESHAPYLELTVPKEDPSRTKLNLYSAAGVYIRRHPSLKGQCYHLYAEGRAFIVNAKAMRELVDKYNLSKMPQRKAWRNAIARDLEERDERAS